MGVMTAVAIGGLVVSAASAGASFAAAAKQRKLQQQAQKDAARALAEAKGKLNVNYYDVLGIQKEPYELQREAMLAQGAQAIEAAQEGERGAAAAAGKVQMAQNEAQAAIRTAMGQEMTELAKLKAAENARLAGIQAAVSLEEVRGAQQAAADAQQAAARQTQQGLSSLQSMGQQAVQAAPLFDKQKPTTTSSIPEGMLPGTKTYKEPIGPPQIPELIQPDLQYTGTLLPYQNIYPGYSNPFAITTNPYYPQ